MQSKSANLCCPRNNFPPIWLLRTNSLRKYSFCASSTMPHMPGTSFTLSNRPSDQLKCHRVVNMCKWVKLIKLRILLHFLKSIFGQNLLKFYGIFTKRIFHSIKFSSFILKTHKFSSRIIFISTKTLIWTKKLISI